MMAKRSRSLARISSLCLLFGTGVGPAAAADDSPSALESMQRVDARDDGDYSIQDMEMTLIDRRGATRVRRMRSYSREHTGLFSYDYDQAKDDDQWLTRPCCNGRTFASVKRRLTAPSVCGGSKRGFDRLLGVHRFRY